MIHYVSHSNAAVQRWLDGWAPELQPRFKLMTYAQLFAAERLPAGTWVFADRERLVGSELRRVAAIWDRLQTSSMPTRLLNDPRRTQSRYGLLATLYRHGYNEHRAYRLGQAAQPRYPVFLRRDSEHTHSLSPLLWSRRELVQSVYRAARLGEPLRDLLVVEFEDTAGKDGLFHKYSAFVMGEKVIPRSLRFARKWVVTASSGLAPEPDQAQTEERWFTTNPHLPWLVQVFKLAGVDYGRIDYSMSDDGPRIWEVNTHPAPLPPKGHSATGPRAHEFAAAFASAWQELDLDGDGHPGLETEPAGVPRFTPRHECRRQDGLVGHAQNYGAALLTRGLPLRWALGRAPAVTRVARPARPGVD